MPFYRGLQGVVIVPLNGQMQASMGITWQLAFVVCPLLSVAVQLEQPKATPAFAGVSSNPPLKSTAIILTRRSIFFFIPSLSFCPHEAWDDDGRFSKDLQATLQFLLGYVQTVVEGDFSAQRTRAGINGRNATTGSYTISVTVDPRATRAVGGDAGSSGCDQQSRTQKSSAEAAQQQYLVFQSSFSFCPNQVGRSWTLYQDPQLPWILC